MKKASTIWVCCNVARLGIDMSMTLNPPAVDATHSRITNIEMIALNVMSIEFEPANSDEQFPSFEPGAHIDVLLPNSLIRQYSLVNRSDNQRYVIAVGLDANSRGGSSYIHQRLAIGDQLTLSKPRNNFPLRECALPVVLVAGGIGITPIWSMVQELEKRQQPWVLYYCARTPEHASFLNEITELATQSIVGGVVTNFDQLEGGSPLDLAWMFKRHTEKSRFYCCGPSSLLEAFVTTAQEQNIPEDQVHIEHFTALATDDMANRAFDVVLNNGTVHHIPADKSILDVLIDADEPVMYSCKDGTCGTCETRVVSGTVEHRDAILTANEKKESRSMMICVSRSTTDKLVLDI